MDKVWDGIAPEVIRILQELDAAERPFPLVSSRKPWSGAADLVLQAGPALSSARSPEGALSGLWLLAGDWDRAHELAQDLATVEGSYWHALVHRMEPDAWNSGYWFRRVGVHPVFPALRGEAASIASRSGLRWRVPERWDPHHFIEFCEQARRKPGSAEETLAEEIQRAEWRLLFRWCAESA